MRRNYANPFDHLGEFIGAEPTRRCGDLRVDFVAREASQINFRATLHARVEARAHGRHPFSDAMCTARAQRSLHAPRASRRICVFFYPNARIRITHSASNAKKHDVVQGHSQSVNSYSCVPQLQHEQACAHRTIHSDPLFQSHC